MPRLLTASQIATGALRRIGAFAARDEAPDPDELDIALGNLDLIVGEMTGTMTCYWLVPDEFSLPLTAAQRQYDLKVAMGSSYPEDGVQFPLSAWLEYPANGGDRPRRKELEIIRRRTYLAKPRLDLPGEPEAIYIDRRDEPKLSTWPVIDLSGYSIVIHYQTYSGNLHESGGGRPHGLPVAWQRWAELAVAADIGDGPVRRLPQVRLTTLMQKAEAAKRDLRSFNNKEHSTRRAVAYRDV